MSAIRAESAERFLAAPPLTVVVFLLYGDNNGLVTLRAQALALRLVGGPSNKAQVLRAEGDALASDPGGLLDEAFAVSMFSEVRAMRVTLGRKNLAEALAPLLERPPQDFFVIVEAGALKRDAPLRTLLEGSDKAAALECPDDTLRDVSAAISAETRAAGIEIRESVRGALAALLPSDRLAGQRELEKLLLYADGRSSISLEDIRACVENGSELERQDIIDAAFLGQQEALSELLTRMAGPGGEPMGVLSGALWHALLLHRMRGLVEAGKSIGEAANAGQRFGLGYSRRAAAEKQLPRFTAASLLAVIGGLQAAVGETRKTSALAPAIVAQVLQQIARRSAARA
jgi:DNA polymerase III subunit delta